MFTQAEQREDLDNYPGLGTNLNSVFRALLILRYFILSAQVQLLSTHTLGEMSKRNDLRILTRVFPWGALWLLTSSVVVGMLRGVFSRLIRCASLAMYIDYLPEHSLERIWV